MTSPQNKNLQKLITRQICGLFFSLAAVWALAGTFLFGGGWLTAVSKLTDDSAYPVYIFCGVILLSCVIACVFTRSILGRVFAALNQVREAVDKMAAGRFKFDMPYTKDDEIGLLCKSLSHAGAVMKDSLEDFSHTIDKMARGDFPIGEQPVGVSQEGDYNCVSSAISTMTTSLHQVFIDIDTASRLVMDGSFQVANNSTALSSGVASQRAALESLDGSMRMLRSQTSKNSSHAAVIRRMTTECRDDARENHKQAVKLLASVEEIARLLQDIEPRLEEMQTQYAKIGALSLNACVTFARRGKLGKEVSKINGEICDASDAGAECVKAMRDLLQRSQSAADRGKRNTNYAAQSLKRLSEKADKASQSSARISHASAAQSHTLDLAGKQLTGISGVVQTNAAIAEQNTAFSEELAAQSQVLSQLVTHFYAQAAVPPKNKRSGRYTYYKEKRAQ